MARVATSLKQRALNAGDTSGSKQASPCTACMSCDEILCLFETFGMIQDDVAERMCLISMGPCVPPRIAPRSPIDNTFV